MQIPGQFWMHINNRNKIGLDVVLEVLHEAWRARRFKMAELDHYVGICRVQHVMRPYLEALVA